MNLWQKRQKQDFLKVDVKNGRLVPAKSHCFILGDKKGVAFSFDDFYLWKTSHFRIFYYWHQIMVYEWDGSFCEKKNQRDDEAKMGKNGSNAKNVSFFRFSLVGLCCWWWRRVCILFLGNGPFGGLLILLRHGRFRCLLMVFFVDGSFFWRGFILLPFQIFWIPDSCIFHFFSDWR